MLLGCQEIYFPLPFAEKVTPKRPPDCVGYYTKLKSFGTSSEIHLRQAQVQFPFPLRFSASAHLRRTRKAV